MTEPIVLAFSGGLDTSFCIPWLAETHGRPVVTVTVDTGGLDAAAAASLAAALARPRRGRPPAGRRARRVLRPRAALPDPRQRAARPGLPAVRRRRAGDPGAGGGARRRPARQPHGGPRLHRGGQRPGALRGGAAHARSRASRSWRRCATSRARAPSRWPTSRSAGLPVPAHGAAYSVNRGLWGVTIGGKETLDIGRAAPRGGLGADPRRLRRAAAAGAPHARLRAAACPSAFDGEALSPVALIERLEAVGGAVRHRPRHPSRRDDPRHQGARRLRGAGRGGAAHRPPRAREARPHRPAASASRRRSPPSTATWCTRASTSIRSAATSRRCCSRSQRAGDRRGPAPLPAGPGVRRGRRLALLAAAPPRAASTARRPASGRPPTPRGFSRIAALPGELHARAGAATAAAGRSRRRRRET